MLCVGETRGMPRAVAPGKLPNTDWNGLTAAFGTPNCILAPPAPPNVWDAGWMPGVPAVLMPEKLIVGDEEPLPLKAPPVLPVELPEDDTVPPGVSINTVMNTSSYSFCHLVP
jgi:hypothetical protein